MKKIITHNADETETAGFELAYELKNTGNSNIFVALYGDLGAGKTAFVRGFVKHFSPESRVKSPTYTIVNEYRRGETPVFHFDLYRVEEPDELAGFGFDEYVKNGICIVEWSENLFDELPENAVKVKISKVDENQRIIEIYKEDEPDL